MTTQTLTIGKRRFVVVAERDFARLQKLAGKQQVRALFADDAMKDLRAYRRTRQATDWKRIKRRLGI